MEYGQLEMLEKELGPSFYVFDVEKLKGNFRKIERAFKSRYGNFIIGYSYKTNYLPYLCKVIDELGGYAEVVSRLEYDLALKIGVDPERIIFNGPVKTYDDIETALNGGSIVNIDSFYEIDYVEAYCEKHKNKLAKIGLRANFDLSENGESPLQEGYPLSRFGFCEENGDFHYAVEKLGNIENARIAGLHGHFSTRERSVSVYEKIASRLCMLAKQYLPPEQIEYIDIGGGIYGELPPNFPVKAPSFDDYAEAVCSVLNDEFPPGGKKPFLILEPGMAMVANTFSFAAKVIETKRVRGTNFVVVDGSVHNVKPTMHKRNLPMVLVKKAPPFRGVGAYHVVGYTCMEKDYIAEEVFGEMPERGDFLMFENTGAYTIVFNPPFIKERPAIVAKHQGEYFCVRKRETVGHFFHEDIYCFQPFVIERKGGSGEYINLQCRKKG